MDTIIQNQSGAGGADVSFTVPLDELRLALDTLEGIRGELGYRELSRATTRSARSRWSAPA